MNKCFVEVKYKGFSTPKMVELWSKQSISVRLFAEHKILFSSNTLTLGFWTHTVRLTIISSVLCRLIIVQLGICVGLIL